MTMGLVALEEIVMGSGTRQRLLCAGVNSPNHPPGTWGPDSRGGGGAAGLTSATGLRGRWSPSPRQILQGWDVSCSKSRLVGELQVPLLSITFSQPF